MKVSIITVCFNSESTIKDTLRSVAAQTYPLVEHIIVDGASRDTTLALARMHAREGAVLVSEPDRGIYDAMNKGVRLATGDIIGFLNSDDFYVHNQVIEQVVNAMQQDGTQAVFGDAEFVRPHQLEIPIRRYRSSSFRPTRIAWGWMPAHPTLFLRRELFEHYGLFKVDYKIAADFELVARMFFNTNIRYRYLPEVLVRMRTGGASTGGIASTMVLNQEVMRACRENGIRTNWLMLLSKYPAKIIEFLT